MFQIFKSKVKYVVISQIQPGAVHMHAVPQKIQSLSNGLSIREPQIFRGQTDDLGKGQSLSMQHVVQHQSILVGESEFVDAMIQQSKI